MYKIALVDLEAVQIFGCGKLGTDEAHINMAAYHSSQAAEKIIKGYLINEGIIPPKEHKIKNLVNFAVNRNIDLKRLEYIVEHADDFDEYISEPRYILNYYSTSKIVMEHHEAMVKLLENLKLNKCNIDNENEVIKN